MTQPLRGRSAVVTGASRGIGAGIARALAEAGARVALLARTESDLAKQASAIGERALAVPCDVTDPAAVEAAVRRISDAFHAVPDILVNNAGIFEVAPVAEMPLEMFLRTMETNLVAPFLVARAMLPGMIASGRGHVVTIGSIADRAIFAENGAYSASKFGLRALHQVMRAELRGTGVRATLVSPGSVDTPLWDAFETETGEQRFQPRGSMLPAEAVVAAVMFALAQPDSVNVDELRLSRS